MLIWIGQGWKQIVITDVPLLKNLTHPVCIARPTRFIRHIQGPRYYKICIHRKKSSSIRYSTRLMSVILRPRFSSFIRL